VRLTSSALLKGSWGLGELPVLLLACGRGAGWVGGRFLSSLKFKGFPALSMGG